MEDTSYKKSKTGFWDHVYGINMECIKPLVLKEPCVDVCKKRMINTNVCKLMEVDLYTVTKEELDFANCYELTFFKNDTFSGLVTWFDIVFSKLPHQVQFSTGNILFLRLILSNLINLTISLN